MNWRDLQAETLPDAALDADIAILGRKGGGKTYTAKGIVERLLDMGRRVLVLDPLGVWAGLRTAADGEAPGYPVAIFGGIHGDMPLDTAAAVPMADILARENVPAVIDLSELSKTAQQSFLFAFLHELRRVNTEALTIVLEEADVFAPQNPQGDDSKQLHSEIDWIARRGRFRGFRLITVTQRPARLSKDVLTQCSTLIAHKLPAPQDRDAVKAWVDGNGDRDLAREVFDTLASLDIGEAWVWAPEHNILTRMNFPAIKTLDTSSTPRAGERRIEPKTLADVDLTGIRAALEAAAAGEDKKGNKKSLKSPENSAPDPEAIAAAEQRGFASAMAIIERESEKLEATWEAMREAVNAMRLAIDAVGSVYDGKPRLKEIPSAALEPMPLPDDIPHGEVNAGGAVISGPTLNAIQKNVRDAMPLTASKNTAASERYRNSFASGPMPPAAGKIVGVIDVKPARSFSWAQVAIMTGYAETGGQFRRGKRWLIDSGTVAEDGAGVRIVKGRGVGAVPTGDALIELWCARVPPSGVAVLRDLWGNVASQHGGGVQISLLAKRLNYATTGGQWRRGVKALRDARIIQSFGDMLKFTDEFCNIAWAS
jgi:hypothetical protein